MSFIERDRRDIIDPFSICAQHIMVAGCIPGLVTSLIQNQFNCMSQSTIPYEYPRVEIYNAINVSTSPLKCPYVHLQAESDPGSSSNASFVEGDRYGD